MRQKDEISEPPPELEPQRERDRVIQQPVCEAEGWGIGAATGAGAGEAAEGGSPP